MSLEKLFFYRWYNMQLLMIFCHSCQWWNVKRIWWHKSTNKSFWNRGIRCWLLIQTFLNLETMQWLTMTRHSLQSGCPLFSRVIDWGKRLLFVFLSLFDLAEWGIMVSIYSSKNTHSVTFVHSEHTIRDHKKQQCLPSVFSL